MTDDEPPVAFLPVRLEDEEEALNVLERDDLLHVDTRRIEEEDVSRFYDPAHIVFVSGADSYETGTRGERRHGQVAGRPGVPALRGFIANGV
jgi:hypothetical protein